MFDLDETPFDCTDCEHRDCCEFYGKLVHCNDYQKEKEEE